MSVLIDIYPSNIVCNELRTCITIMVLHVTHKCIHNVFLIFPSLNMQIFSHMSDGYLLQTSVPKISTIGLLECLFITTQFEMRTLGGKYSEALVQRLDNNNFIQVRLTLLCILLVLIFYMDLELARILCMHCAAL